MLLLLRRWPLLAPGLVMLALFGYAVAPGLSGTSDSVHYLWAAHTLRTMRQLLSPDGTPYRFWGPLYPTLLAGFHGPAGVRLLHGGALLAQLGLWYWLGRWLLTPGRALALAWLVALSTAVLVPAKFIWSEPVFGALTAAYICTLLAWGRTGRPGWLVLATVAGFLVPLQRTSGFFLLAGAGVGLLLAGQWRNWRLLVPHWLGCAAGGLAWNYYAELVAGPPVYQAVLGWAVLGQSIADYGFILTRWFVPLGASWVKPLALVWALVLPLLFWLLWPRGNSQPWRNRPAAQSEKFTSRQSLRLLWCIALVNILALLVAVNASRAAAGPHDAERYCAILVGPVVILALARWPVGAAGAWPLAEGQWRWAGRLLLAGWLAYSAVRVGHNMHALRQGTPMEWPAATASQP